MSDHRYPEVSAEWPVDVVLARFSEETRAASPGQFDHAPWLALVPGVWESDGYEKRRYVPEDTSLLADLEAEVEYLRNSASIAEDEEADRLQALIDKHKPNGAEEVGDGVGAGDLAGKGSASSPSAGLSTASVDSVTSELALRVTAAFLERPMTERKQLIADLGVELETWDQGIALGEVVASGRLQQLASKLGLDEQGAEGEEQVPSLKAELSRIAAETNDGRTHDELRVVIQSLSTQPSFETTTNPKEASDD